MGACFKFLLILHLLAASAIFGLIWSVLDEQACFPFCPEVGENPPRVTKKWFGPGAEGPGDGAEDKSVRKFDIRVDDKTLTDLRHRLELDLQRLTDPLENSAFRFGFNTVYLRDVADFWLRKFDWRRQEKALDALGGHFQTTIDGLDVHFVHAKPDPKKAKGKKILPLLIVHGWPGSVFEFHQLLPMLTSPHPDRDFVFEVIAPSIPGYGWSSAPRQEGFNSVQCARVFHTLMTERLGFARFYTQGGDWGAMITSSLVTAFPQSVQGSHFNMISDLTPKNTLRTLLASILPSGWVLSEEDREKALPMGEKFSNLLLETGYAHIQGTKPDTLGVSLNNSPLGLAAYILEKFSTWTNKANRNSADGNLTEKFSLDHLLTNVMVYWTTGSITSSVRFYKENLSFGPEIKEVQSYPVHVPVGAANFANEIALQPRSYCTGKYKNIISFNDYDQGGHFAAFEEPKLLAQDIFGFVGLAEEWHGARGNPGKPEL